MNNKKIKNRFKKGTLINAGNYGAIEDKKVFFSFTDFRTKSIDIDNFNNFYLKIEDSRNAVHDFFDIAKAISGLYFREFFSTYYKKEFHLNKLEDPISVGMIEKVLKQGYDFPQESIDEFEQMYFEYQINDGKRVICYIVDNVIHPLFIDNNHMICGKSSRFLKSKKLYKIPSSFYKTDINKDSDEEKNIKIYLKDILDEYESDNNMSAEEIIRFLKDIV